MIGWDTKRHIRCNRTRAASRTGSRRWNNYDVLDTPQEEAFDRVTRLVRSIFGVSMSTVTLIDGHRQWFKSQQGMPNQETERGPALCNAAINHSRPLIVPDTLQDRRFADNPFVTGAPFIRFYAGVQLRSPEGHAVGTLCAMHDQPRTFDNAQLAILVDLAKTVTSELELRTLATRDALTGALSRRALREEFSRAISLARRHKFELSCIFFDLDHFKTVNDTHGHGVGDLVLRACVEACRGELRATDTIGRFGGEEFAVLLPHTGGQGRARSGRENPQRRRALPGRGRNRPGALHRKFWRRRPRRQRYRRRSDAQARRYRALCGEGRRPQQLPDVA